MAGGIHKPGKNAKTASPLTKILHSDEEFLLLFSEEEYERLKDLNALDMEFYEWAKDRILADAGFEEDESPDRIEEETETTN